MSDRIRRISIALAALAIPLATACDSEATGPMGNGPETGIIDLSLEPGNAVLLVGERVQLEAQGSGRTGLAIDASTVEAVIWVSSDPEIVSVSETGMIEAHAVGSAVITAGCGGFDAFADVTVVQSEELDTPAAALVQQ